MSFVNFGFSIGDLVLLSSLALNLYRKCRDCSKDFAALSNEGKSRIHSGLWNLLSSCAVIGLRVIVDDIRVTVKEQSLGKEEEEQLIRIGQGCLDVLRELEAVLRKYQSLGSRSRRTWDRLRWEKDRITDIRQRLISNTALLTSLNMNLTRQVLSSVDLEYTKLIMQDHLLPGSKNCLKLS
jgi:hypothetical protein